MKCCQTMFIVCCAMMLFGVADCQEMRMLSLAPVKTIEPVAGVDPGKALTAQQQGVCVWNGECVNRRNIAGAIFYINHPGGAFRVDMRFNSIGVGRPGLGDFSDGKPQPLVLRVFNPRDRSIFAANIGQLTTGWFETSIDLTDLPAGRYRFSTNGWHDGFALATAPATPVGVLGARSASMEGAWERYVYVPHGVTAWSADFHTYSTDQKAAIIDPEGKVAAQATLPRAGDVYSFHRLNLPKVQGDSVWRIRYEGTGRHRVTINGIPGILWPTEDAVRAAAGDQITVAGRTVAHEWQRPLVEWLTTRTEKDFALDVDTMPAVDSDRLPDDLAIRLAMLCGPYDLFSNARALIKYNQIADTASPNLGLFVEGPKNATTLADNPYFEARRYGQLGYVRILAELLATDAGGLNPYYNNPQLLNRAMAGAFQVLLEIPEDQIVMYSSFQEVGRLGDMGALLYHHMPPELAEPFRAGLLEMVGRVGYWDGYVSNQGLNNLYGVKYVADITNDPTLKSYYEQYITAFIAGKFYGPHHGQTPAGFYQEGGGFDGAYNTFSAYFLMRLWHMTHDHRIYASLARSFELTRHLAVTLPDGSLTSARNWNTRTGSMAFIWHDHRAGASIPGSAAFWQAKGFESENGKAANDARAYIKQNWGAMRAETTLKSPYTEWWGANGWYAFYCSPPYADPLPLGCQEEGPFARTFGEDYDRNFLAGRVGPWYLILFGGDTWRSGANGSGLATLWHHDFGPLIAGDTKMENSWAKKLSESRPPVEVMLSLTDAWDHTEGGNTKRVSTEKQQSALHGDAKTGVFSALVRPDKDAWRLTRTYTVEGNRLTSNATIAESTFTNHDLYLPLVAGPHVTLTPLDANGQPLNMAIGDAATVRGWRWTSAEHPERTITLTFPRPVDVTYFGETPGAKFNLNTTLRFFRVRLGTESGAWVIE